MVDEEYKKRLKAELEREQKSREKMEELAREDFGKFIEGLADHSNKELREAIEKTDPKVLKMLTAELWSLMDIAGGLQRKAAAYETLEMQIIKLWKQRGFMVKEIRVDSPAEGGEIKWTVIAEEIQDVQQEEHGQD